MCARVRARARVWCLLKFDFLHGHKFDAFCLCLEGGTTAATASDATAGTKDDALKEPYERMCDWLLEIASSLIRPDALGPPRIKSPADTAAGKAVATADICPLPVEKRFHYFMRSVRKARVWQDEDGALFRRLQASCPVHLSLSSLLKQIA